MAEVVGWRTIADPESNRRFRDTSGLEINDDWEREFTVVSLVQVNPDTEGLFAASRATGLPTPGSVYKFPGDNEDIWAFCRPSKSVKPHGASAGERYEFYTVEQKFSTKPLKSCKDYEVTDPILIPPKLTGGFSKDKEEALYDKDGKAIRTSSHELIRGQQNEWDTANRTVKVEQNVLDLERTLIDPMIDTVNDSELWGYPARSVRLMNFTWEEKWYGACYKYYTRTLEFEVRVKRWEFVLDLTFPDPDIIIPGPVQTFLVPNWDRDVVDEGTKALHGRQVPDNGSGCTVDITVDPDDGHLTNVVLNAHGTKYPKNVVVPLYVTRPHDNIGRNGVILVQTDNAGTVTSIVLIHLEGFGYENGVGVATVQRGNWCITLIGNRLPSSDNPQDFIRYQDPKSNQCKVILDGRGLPIGLDEDPGTIHVAKYPASNFVLLDLPELPN